MATLPQLIEEDVSQISCILREYLSRTDTISALLIDKGGFLVAQAGNNEEFDTTTIAALASGAFLANQTIANLVHETNFDSVYQQGEKFSMYVKNVDEHCLLVAIFPAAVGVGIVKYYGTGVCQGIAAQLAVAQERDPGTGLDLSVLNVADTADFFKKR